MSNEKEIKEELKAEIRELNVYVNMTKLLNDIGISSGNYFAFMSGDDGRLSKKSLNRIIEALQERPINSGCSIKEEEMFEI